MLETQQEGGVLSQAPPLTELFVSGRAGVRWGGWGSHLSMCRESEVPPSDAVTFTQSKRGYIANSPVKINPSWRNGAIGVLSRPARPAFELGLS